VAFFSARVNRGEKKRNWGGGFKSRGYVGIWAKPKGREKTNEEDQKGLAGELTYGRPTVPKRK